MLHCYHLCCPMYVHHHAMHCMLPLVIDGIRSNTPFATSILNLTLVFQLLLDCSGCLNCRGRWLCRFRCRTTFQLRLVSLPALAPIGSTSHVVNLETRTFSFPRVDAEGKETSVRFGYQPPNQFFRLDASQCSFRSSSQLAASIRRYWNT